MAISQRIFNPKEKTLGEFLQNNYPGFTAWGGEAPMDMDISHGVEIEYADNRKYGHGEHLSVYPFILWSDGCYKPCHYWGQDKYLYLERG